jgi:arylsulfatase A-like enzyme
VIAPGTESDLLCASWDYLPTLLEAAQCPLPEAIDGLSFLSTLRGQQEEQPRHEFLYWELGNQQALRAGPWKLVRRSKEDQLQTELFHLGDDPGEQQDLSTREKATVQRLIELARSARTTSPLFPSTFDDGR